MTITQIINMVLESYPNANPVLLAVGMGAKQAYYMPNGQLLIILFS